MFGKYDGPNGMAAISPIWTQAVQQPAQFAGVYGQNFGNYAQGLGSLGNNYTGAYGAYNSGLSNVATAQSNERAARYQANAMAAAAGQQAAGNLASAQASGLSNALGNWASAQATGMGNALAAQYGSNAMAEAARQGAVGNIGSAALGAYGSAANSAMQAWANNQMAYNKSAADMHAANASNMGMYGQSRNNALASLGAAYGGIGQANIAANAIGDETSSSGQNASQRNKQVSTNSSNQGSNKQADLNSLFGGGGFGGGGDTFSAFGPGGSLASGSYGGLSGAPGFGGSGTGGGGINATSSGSSTGTNNIDNSSDSSSFANYSKRRGPGGGGEAALQGLDNLRQSVMSADIPNRLDTLAAVGRQQLDDQHYSSRQMPSQMLGQALSGLTSLGDTAYSHANNGMNQFYSSQPSVSSISNAGSAAMGSLGSLISGIGGGVGNLGSYYDAQDKASKGDLYGRILDDMKSGYGTAGGQLRGVQRDLSGGYRAANDQVSNLWDNSLGNLDLFQSPLQAAQKQRAADLYSRGNQLRDQVWNWQNSAFPTMAESFRNKLNTMPTV
jgi:hypothetical protein